MSLAQSWKAIYSLSTRLCFLSVCLYSTIIPMCCNLTSVPGKCADTLSQHTDLKSKVNRSDCKKRRSEAPEISRLKACCQRHTRTPTLNKAVGCQQLLWPSFPQDSLPFRCAGQPKSNGGRVERTATIQRSKPLSICLVRDKSVEVEHQGNTRKRCKSHSVCKQRSTLALYILQLQCSGICLPPLPTKSFGLPMPT